MEWIDIKTKLPEDQQEVEFLHDGYKFKGKFCNKPFPFPFGDPLGDPFSNINHWYFVSNSKDGSVTTFRVSAWRPFQPERLKRVGTS